MPRFIEKLGIISFEWCIKKISINIWQLFFPVNRQVCFSVKKTRSIAQGLNFQSTNASPLWFDIIKAYTLHHFYFISSFAPLFFSISFPRLLFVSPPPSLSCARFIKQTPSEYPAIKRNTYIQWKRRGGGFTSRNSAKALEYVWWRGYRANRSPERFSQHPYLGALASGYFGPEGIN